MLRLQLGFDLFLVVFSLYPDLDLDLLPPWLIALLLPPPLLLPLRSQLIMDLERATAL